ncbi:DNA repair and recombination protein rad54b [Desmophyllum pertusum]|uniref:DNA repair and recombination protein rad54b n=1 Tax=Desmophyllum pertusum TaxID=174260 RepID=A0A9W9YZ52_9CNID|nr:DNA repair and recombination protein rad54b [Desmophyllum pertusum]
MSSLETLELTGADGSIVQAEEMEALFGGFNKTLPLWKLTVSGFSVSGCLNPLTKSFRFFPNLRNLCFEEFNMDERNLCHLLESLTFIPNLKELRVDGEQLSHAHCCTAEVNTAASFTHKTLRSLVLSGISLTPAAAAALGRSLPEMSSLEELELTGANGSIVQAEEMEALFGGFNKTLPLEYLTFKGFSVRGCLAPLTKSLRYFPNLSWLDLYNLDMDERSLRGLLESFQFIPNLETLYLSYNPLGHAVTSIVPHVINLPKLEDLHINQTGLNKPFVCNVKRDVTTETRQVVTPRHDVNAPGALVMPRPSATHQLEHNRGGLDIRDVVVDPHVSQHLRPHQRDGVMFLYECVMGLRNLTEMAPFLRE